MRVPIETSARHVHLSQEDFEILFGKGRELTVKTMLSQPGQFACEERVAVKGSSGCFERVSVLGPFRSRTQVEISLSDARKLGVEGMIRQSGDTKDTPGCTLVGPKGEIRIDQGVIAAKRHIHMTPKDAQELNVKDGEAFHPTFDWYGEHYWEIVYEGEADGCKEAVAVLEKFASDSLGVTS